MSLVKKILLGGSLIATVVPATIVMASCSSTSESSFDLGISEATEKYYGEQITKKLATDPTVVKRKTMLITAAGVVNDKSFNESAWGALELYKKQAGISASDRSTITFRETKDPSELAKFYDEAMSGQYKTLVLTGFQQEAAFGDWLKISGNTEKFKASQAVIIGVDWNGSTVVPAGQFFGLGFKTEEASWVVGQAASNFLTSTTGRKPHLNTFGGGTFDGVTDFTNGFLQGMLDWNSDATNKGKEVKFYSGNTQTNTITLDTGFTATADIIGKIKNIVGTGENAPQIILPVAGSLTGTTLQDIKDKRSGQLLIGVDSNQSLAFPNDKATFFSSVEKKVAVGVYKAMVLLAGIELNFSAGGQSDSGFQSDFIAAGGTGTPKNAYVKYGFDKDLVGFSKSTLNGEQAAIANKALDDAYKAFKEKKPTFKPMTNPSNNQSILDSIIKEINEGKTTTTP